MPGGKGRNAGRAGFDKERELARARALQRGGRPEAAESWLFRRNVPFLRDATAGLRAMTAPSAWDHSRSRISGTWSDGWSQARAFLKISNPRSAGANGGVTRTWSRRQP